MKSRFVSLEDFICQYRFWGTWEISYTDDTHLWQERGEYVVLGEFILNYNEEKAQEFPILPFTFRPVTKAHIKDYFTKLPEGGEQAKRAANLIREQLAEGLTRTGLLRPVLSVLQNSERQNNFLKVLDRMSEFPYLTIVLDTGAVRRGAISFLHQVLRGVAIWTVVPVFVMGEIQNKVETLTKKRRSITENANERKPANCTFIGERPQVSCTSRELGLARRWRPVELLTPTVPFTHKFFNEDRLIIESVKNLQRERGLHKGVYLVTSDKDMASLAALEGVNVLHVGVSTLPNSVSSIRFDPQSHFDPQSSIRSYIQLVPVHYMLWDMAQVFSRIRIRSQEQKLQYEILYYSGARDGFIAQDAMEIQEEQWTP